MLEPDGKPDAVVEAPRNNPPQQDDLAAQITETSTDQSPAVVPEIGDGDYVDFDLDETENMRGRAFDADEPSRPVVLDHEPSHDEPGVPVSKEQTPSPSSVRQAPPRSSSAPTFELASAEEPLRPRPRAPSTRAPSNRFAESSSPPVDGAFLEPRRQWSEVSDEISLLSPTESLGHPPRQAAARTRSSFPGRFGKYELLERIGIGGMAEVFRARIAGFEGFQKTLVIKKLFPHLMIQESFAQMFIEEAKLAARIQHRNIVQVYELGRLDSGELYMAMEHVAGPDLRVLLRSANKRALRLPLWFTLHVASEILNGLSYAHELKDEDGKPLEIVHRDVTPANIFIAGTGDVKLGDFGIAKSRATRSLTRAGEIKGKIAYMAPEQILSEKLDRRADIFALGAVLWECITQRRLFDGNTDIQIMTAICTGPRTPPSELNPECPPELDECVLAALEADPRRRMASAADFQRQIVSALSRIRPQLIASDVRQVVDELLGRSDTGSLVRTGPTWTSSSPPSGPNELPGALTRPTARARPPRSPIPAPSEPPEPLRTEDFLVNEVEEPPPAAISTIIRPAARKAVPAAPAETTRDPTPLEINFEDDRDTPPKLPVERSWLSPEQPLIMHSIVPVADPRARLSAPPWAGSGYGAPAPELGAPLPRSNSSPATVAHSGGYQGPYPYYLRHPSGLVWGPCAYAQIHEYVDTDVHARAGLSVSGDGKTWMPLDQFARLTGQERFSTRAEPARPAEGDLKQRSLTRLMFALRARNATGRLMLWSDAATQSSRREIHVVDGQPTYVLTDDGDRQIPELLVRRGLVHREALAGVLHDVLVAQRSIEVAAAKHSPEDVRLHWPLLMKDRLAELFEWRSGRYAFHQNSDTWRSRPFARSLLAVLLEMVHRSRTDPMLEDALAGYWHVSFTPSEKLGVYGAELGMTANQAIAAQQLASGRTLASILPKRANEQKPILILAYVLIETGLLLKPL